jgi:hypothetical protein
LPFRMTSRNSSGRRIRASRGNIYGAGGKRRSGAQASAALVTPRRENRAAGPGTHAQPEAMNLRAPTVVRLKRTLAHWSSRVTVRICLHKVADGIKTAIRAQPVNGTGDAHQGQTRVRSTAP